MKIRLFRLLLTSLLAASCAHTAPAAVDNTPLIGKMQKTDVTFSLADPDSKFACKADDDCPTGDYCHPEQLVCFQSYPHPRMLEMSLNAAADCKIVNVYFPFDSVELVAKAEEWLNYNIRCIKSRGVQALRLNAFCDARGSQSFNHELSEKRGEVVKEYLRAHGLDITLTVHGQGKHHPMKAGTSEKAYAFNRRVEFQLAP